MDSWIEESHPLRAVVYLVDPILDGLSADFDTIYSNTGHLTRPNGKWWLHLLPTVTQAIRQIKQAVRSGEFELDPITLSRQENLTTTPDSPQSDWIRKCIKLFK